MTATGLRGQGRHRAGRTPTSVPTPAPAPPVVTFMGIRIPIITKVSHHGLPTDRINTATLHDATTPNRIIAWSIIIIIIIMISNNNNYMFYAYVEIDCKP